MYLFNSNLNEKITDNFINVKLIFLTPTILLLSMFFCYFLFFSDSGKFNEDYINIQKDMFFYLNGKLSEYPIFEFNLTQFGDVLISFSLLSVFIVYAPKIWEALLTSGILALIISATLKELFNVPRPAQFFDNDTFIIIGRTHLGFASLPSGHSISTFFVITVLLFAFMPKRNIRKIFWFFALVVLGLIIVFSRVGVGAHFPFDVIIGSAIGYMIAVIGIKINNKSNWFGWIKNKKHLPILIVLLSICAWVLAIKVIRTKLVIFNLSFFSLFVTLCFLIKKIVCHKKLN